METERCSPEKAEFLNDILDIKELKRGDIVPPVRILRLPRRRLLTVVLSRPVGLLHMQLDLDLRTVLPVPSKTDAAHPARLGQGEKLAGEDADSQIQRLAGYRVDVDLAVVAAVAPRLEHPTSSVGKHGVIDHHALVRVLPVHGHHLHAPAPVEAGIGVAAVESGKGVGVDAHEAVSVVLEDAAGLVAVFEEVGKGGLAEAKDATRGPRPQFMLLKVLTVRVDTKGRELFANRWLATSSALDLGGSLATLSLSLGQAIIGGLSLDLDQDLVVEFLERWLALGRVTSVKRFVEKKPVPFFFHNLHHDLLLLALRTDLEANNDGQGVLLESACANGAADFSKANRCCHGPVVMDDWLSGHSRPRRVPGPPPAVCSATRFPRVQSGPAIPRLNQGSLCVVCARSANVAVEQGVWGKSWERGRRKVAPMA